MESQVFSEKREIRQQRLSYLDNQNILVLVAEQGNQICGFSCLFLSDDLTTPTYMDNLHVDSVMHGKGIGKQLIRKSLEHVFRHSPEAGLYLWVFENNTKAVNFYLKQGAKITGDAIQNAPGGSTVKALKKSWTNLKDFRVSTN